MRCTQHAVGGVAGDDDQPSRTNRCFEGDLVFATTPPSTKKVRKHIRRSRICWRLTFVWGPLRVGPRISRLLGWGAYATGNRPANGGDLPPERGMAMQGIGRHQV